MAKKKSATPQKHDPQNCSHDFWNLQKQPNGAITLTCFLCDFSYEITAQEVKSLSALDVEKLMKKRSDQARLPMGEALQTIKDACAANDEPEASRLAQMFNQRFTSVIAYVQRDSDEVLRCIPIEAQK